jgi:hypothetical protein
MALKSHIMPSMPGHAVIARNLHCPKNLPCPAGFSRMGLNKRVTVLPGNMVEIAAKKATMAPFVRRGNFKVFFAAQTWLARADAAANQGRRQTKVTRKDERTQWHNA